MANEEMPQDPTGLRYYGGDGTIHRTGQLDVEVDAWGNVVAVWFRCQPLPFKQVRVAEPRAAEMRGMYGSGVGESIDAVVLKERP